MARKTEDYSSLDVPDPGEKCEHGVRLAKGDLYARYCTGCNPKAEGIRTPFERKAVAGVIEREHEPDTVEYLARPVGLRFAEIEL